MVRRSPTSQLKLVKNDVPESVASENDSSEDSDGDSQEEFNVEKILKSKRNKDGEVVYFVKWEGYGESENTWEPEENLTNCAEMLAKFKAANSATKKPAESSASQSPKKRRVQETISEEVSESSSDENDGEGVSMALLQKRRDIHKRKEKKARLAASADQSPKVGVHAALNRVADKYDKNMKSPANAAKEKAKDQGKGKEKATEPLARSGSSQVKKSLSSPAQSSATSKLPASTSKTPASTSKAATPIPKTPVVVSPSKLKSSTAKEPPSPQRQAPPPPSVKKPPPLFVQETSSDESDQPSKPRISTSHSLPPPTPSTKAADDTSARAGPSGLGKLSGMRSFKVKPADPSSSSTSDQQPPASSRDVELGSPIASTSTPTEQPRPTIAVVIPPHVNGHAIVNGANSSPGLLRKFRAPDSTISGPFSFTPADIKPVISPVTKDPRLARTPSIGLEGAFRLAHASPVVASTIASALPSPIVPTLAPASPTAEEKAKALAEQNEALRADLERKLKISNYYKKTALFNHCSLPIACAEAIRMPRELPLRIHGRACSIIQGAAPPGLDRTDHDGENMTLGVLLLALDAKTPTQVQEIETIFLYRDHAFHLLASCYIELVDRKPPVEFFAFGRGQVMAPVLSHGYAIIPTMAAIANVSEFEKFLIVQRRSVSIDLRVHPASLVLAATFLKYEQLQPALRAWLNQSAIHRVQNEHLARPPTSSPYHSLNHKDLLSGGKHLPPTTLSSEFEDIQTTLIIHRETMPGNRRRFIIVTENPDAAHLLDCAQRGLHLLTWDQLNQKIAESPF